MRSIGKLERADWAQRFVAYLIAEGVESTAEEEDGAWTIWVHDEDALPQARESLSQFLAAPDDRRYAAAIPKANQRIKEKVRQREQIAKRMVDVRTQWGRGHSGRPARVTVMLIVVTVIVSLAAGLAKDPKNAVYRKLTFCDTYQPIGWRGDTLGEKLVDICRGEVWRIITPNFLHLGLWHLAFNMYGLFVFGSQIELRRGPWTLLALVSSIGIVNTLVTSLAPSQMPWPFTHLSGSVFTIGMSGVLYGLAGFTWLSMRRDPRRDLYMPDQWTFILIIWLVLGIVGILEMIIGPVSNLGHLIGLLSGLAAAWIVIEFRTRRRGRSDSL